MCTYEGERHLEEQLESLAQQTHPPDQIVIRDDGSSDRSLELLAGFRTRASCPVDITVNPVRLGYTKNFERAISQCRGDFVLLCDQDDIWHPAKIERIVKVLGSAPNMVGVFSDAELVDGNSRLLPGRLWGAVGFTPRSRRRFLKGHSERVRLLCRANVVSGATLGFASRFRDLLLPIPEGWVHDEWIALMLAATADLRMIPLPLVRYRIHGGQQIGVRSTRGARRWMLPRTENARRTGPGSDAYLDRARLLGGAYARLVDRSDMYSPDSDALGVIRSCTDHLRVRSQILSAHGGLGLASRELLRGRYHRYSKGWASAAKDVFAVS
jgi:glycosyltransferase involved in cell wall biosynthesis